MKLCLALSFLVMSFSFGQNLEFVSLDVGLRNPSLLAKVEESVKRAMYYEDEGIERRIRDVTQEPRIYLIGKDERVARELHISSSYKTAFYYAGTNRRAPPYRTTQFDCSTRLVKDADLVWQDYDSDCDFVPEWD